jgi:anti-sigma regulatory factor (Ser/Thr protein kinase)
MIATVAPVKSGEVFDLNFEATFEAVSAAGESIAPALDQCFGEERGAQLRLGLVEALTNVVEHGCAGRTDGQVRLRAVAGPSQWCFTLFDNGTPIPHEALKRADGSVFDFNPDDTSALPEGGMGLSLILMVFDRVDYKVAPAGNQLMLSAYLKT